MPFPEKITSEVDLVNYDLPTRAGESRARYEALETAHSQLEHERLPHKHYRQVISDCHANGGLLGTQAVLHGSLKFSSHEDFNGLLMVCNSFNKRAPDSRLLQPEERQLLTQILADATYNTERPILSLGDETADRHRSDEIILRVFDALEKNGVKCNVLESNHGMEFSKFYHHCRKQTLSDWKLFECFMPEYAPSLIAFEEAIVRGDIDKEEAEALMERHLQRKRLLDAHLDDQGNLFIYVHAAIDSTKTIRELCKLFAIRYDDGTNQKLLDTIHRINEKYQTLLLSGDLFQQAVDAEDRTYLPSRDEFAAASQALLLSDPLNPLVRCIWGRAYFLTVQQAREAYNKNRHFVFGHLGQPMLVVAGTEGYPVLTCLDTKETGKSLNDLKGAVIWTSHLDSHSLDMRMRLASNPGASTSTAVSSLLHPASGSRTMQGYGSIPSSPNEHRDDPDKERTSGWCCCCRR